METKTIETPKGKNKVEIKEWITGREGIEIDKPIMDIKFQVNTLGQGTADLNIGEAYRLSKEIAVSTIVISIDGDNKDILKRILDMSKIDYDFIMEEIDKVIKGENFTKPIPKQESGID